MKRGGQSPLSPIAKWEALPEVAPSNRDYLACYIEEPSFPSSGWLPTIAPSSSSPSRKTPAPSSLWFTSSSPARELDSVDDEVALASPASSPSLYCQACRKKFASQTTLDVHMNSAKHKKAILQSGATNSAPSTPSPKNTKQSPQKSVAPAEQDQKKMLSEAVKLLHDAQDCQDQPNKASLLYFKAAKAFAELYRLKDCGVALYSVLNLQAPKNQGREGVEETLLDSNVIFIEEPNKAKLLYTVHLYLGRVQRGFDDSTARHHFLQAVYLFLSQARIERVVDMDVSALPPAVLQRKCHKIFADMQRKLSEIQTLWAVVTRDEQFILSLNEAAGFFALRGSLSMGLILYMVAAEVAKHTERWEEYGKALDRATKICLSMDIRWTAIDLMLRAVDDMPNSEVNNQRLFNSMLGAIVLEDRIRIMLLLDKLRPIIDESKRLQFLVRVAEMELAGPSTMLLDDLHYEYRSVIHADGTLKQFCKYLAARISS